MSNSNATIWIHAIWTTRNKQALIHSKLKRRLFNFIREYLQEQGCKVLIVNGDEYHVQCLFKQNYKRALSELIGPAKGQSSHYVNYFNLTDSKFSWQVGFNAFSISEEDLLGLLKKIESNPLYQDNFSKEQKLAI